MSQIKVIMSDFRNKVCFENTRITVEVADEIRLTICLTISIQ